jgi:hypothetical protein
MRGFRRVWVLIALASGCVPIGAEIGGTGGGPNGITEDMVPDPAYQPRVGDQAVLFGLDGGQPLPRLPVMKDLTAYDICVRAAQTRDSERLRELEEQGWLQWLPPGTKVSILDIHDRNHTGADTATQIRIPDEAHKNQSYWTPSNLVTRLIRKGPE